MKTQIKRNGHVLAEHRGEITLRPQTIASKKLYRRNDKHKVSY